MWCDTGAYGAPYIWVPVSHHIIPDYEDWNGPPNVSFFYSSDTADCPWRFYWILSPAKLQIIDVNVSRYRHAGDKGERRYCSYFLTLALDGDEWPASHPGGALPSVPTEYEAGWASELFWIQRLEEISFASVGDRTRLTVCSQTLQQLSYPSYKAIDTPLPICQPCILLGNYAAHSGIMVLGTPHSKLLWATDFFGLLRHNWCIPQSLQMFVVFLLICFSLINSYLNWGNHRLPDLSVGASVLYKCQKLCSMVMTDLNSAHTWAFCWMDAISLTGAMHMLIPPHN
jgi:hypothetical protein